ncbi:hypothetical protein KP509_01G081000 [Ceratopteris richardii]|uniref:Uncharacterized protein n=1 Tax=Ceratopteris richardii TaxID=49495 RepID=A0A8T2VIK3_CERRI|nr:hypothetical protein KP509_01G081000 [Ceratopteris richardii]
MKSSFKKLRNFALHKSSTNSKHAASDTHRAQGPGAATRMAITQPLASTQAVDELRVLPGHRRQGDDHGEKTQALTHMQEQYDGLLAAAQSVSGSAYDLSNALHEMASYIIETFGKAGDGDIGSSLSMLAKVQYEISKLLVSYATHVSQAIVTPTKSFLEELESLKEAEGQYERERDSYKNRNLKNVNTRHRKEDASDKNLNSISEKLNNQATQLDRLVQSLKQGQEQNLMMQTAKHHRAQVQLFGKGLNLLNAVEFMIKQVTADFHIDDALSDDDEPGLESDKNNYAPKVYSVEENNDDATMLSSSPISTQFATMERRKERSSLVKPWENTSKSAPLRSSLYDAMPHKDTNIERPSVKATTYALPNQMSQTAMSYKHSESIAGREEYQQFDEHLEPHRVKTGSTSTLENARGLTEASKLEAYNPDHLRHTLGIENNDIHTVKENMFSHYAGRNPGHSHSTSFSESLDAFSSHRQLVLLASPPTTDYRKSRKANGLNMMANTSVDPLYKSGPVGRSAPWGMAPSRVSPCCSPPMSHSNSPLISELHKLPAPPTQAASASKPEHGSKGLKSGSKMSKMTSNSAVKKSHSVSASASFGRSLSHNKIIKSSDSPVVESP